MHRFYSKCVIPSNLFSALSQTRYRFVYLVELALYMRRDELALVSCQDEDTYYIRVLDEKGNDLIREVYPG